MASYVADQGRFKRKVKENIWMAVEKMRKEKRKFERNINYKI